MTAWAALVAIVATGGAVAWGKKADGVVTAKARHGRDRGKAMTPRLAARTAGTRTADAAEARALAADPVLGGARTIRGGEAPGMVAFTFDDGPRAGTTDKVIDALLAYDVPATFFVVGHRITGKRADDARALVARMVEHGFLVGNHTWSHPHLRALGDRRVAAEIDGTTAAIHGLTGAAVGLFRPPYGAHGKRSAAHATHRQLTSVLWSIDSSDWRKPRAARMRKAIVEAIFADDGGVVLMHDTKPLTAQTIAGILDDLEAGNCARLAAGDAPVVPVSLHYFLRDADGPRPVPAEVAARTQRYVDGLPARCTARSKGERENR